VGSGFESEAKTAVSAETVPVELRDPRSAAALGSRIGNRALARLAGAATPAQRELLAHGHLPGRLARQTHTAGVSQATPLSIVVHGGRSFTDPEIDGRGSIQQTAPEQANWFYFRHDWAPPAILLEAQGAGTHAMTWEPSRPGQPVDPALGHSPQPGRFLVSKPASPGAVFVTCRRGGSRTTVIVYFVGATMTINTSGSPQSGNPVWPATQAFLRRRYIGNQPFAFDALGLFTSAATTAFSGQTRYGALVEMIATVTPPDTPHVWQARRLIDSNVRGEDARGHVLHGRRGPSPPPLRPGGEDTTWPAIQGHNLDGRHFDYDMPGGTMSSANERGDRHIWQLTFEQVLAFGTVPASTDDRLGDSDTDPTTGVVTQTPGFAYFAETLAHHRDVSPIVRWRADYVATCESPLGTLVPTVRMQGSVRQL
jgi:hypothetical protein